MYAKRNKKMERVGLRPTLSFDIPCMYSFGLSRKCSIRYATITHISPALQAIFPHKILTKNGEFIRKD
jgi:hypothetical protein